MFLPSFVLAQQSVEFQENKGQWPKKVKYKAAVNSGTFYAESTSFTVAMYNQQLINDVHNNEIEFHPDLKIDCHAFKVDMLGARADADVIPSEPKSWIYNYFIGNDKSKWASDVRAFSALTYENIYDGIDWHIYSRGASIKYDFVVHPRKSPDKISMQVHGAEVFTNENKLFYKTQLGLVEENKPVAYQFINREYIEVPCKFVVEGDLVSFEIGDYDTSHVLVIDPDLVFSTFSGSLISNFGYTATYDNAGNLYSGSTAFGIGYPTTLGAYSTTFAMGNTDIVLSKFNSDGSALIYSTYLGGFGDEMPHSLIVNDANELYMLGTSGAFDFPMVNALKSNMSGGPNFSPGGLGITYTNGCDIVVAKLSSGGNQLLASTYLGGSDNDGLNTNSNLKYNYADEVRGEILIDKNGDILIASTTSSSNFAPMFGGISNTYSGGAQDGILLKLSPNLNQLIWGTYLGGNNADAIYSVAVDSDNDIYVAGGTNSTNINAFSFPFFNNYSGGRADGFIQKVSENGQNLLLSSYFGTSDYDQIYFIDVDASKNIYVLGQTETNSSPFQINAAFGQSNGGQFVSKFNPQLNGFIWSSQFGVSPPNVADNAMPNISPTAFLVDVCNAVYIAGWGGTTNISAGNNASTTTGLPVTPDAVQDTTDGSDFYLLVLRDDGSAPVYASFFGGNNTAEHVDGGTSRFDKSGKVYQAVCAGCGGNSNMLTTPNAHSSVNAAVSGPGLCNLGVFKYNFEMPLVIANFITDDEGCAPYQALIDNNSISQGASTYTWSINGGVFSFDTIPFVLLTTAGDWNLQLLAEDSMSCNLTDTFTLRIRTELPQNIVNQDIILCLADTVEIGVQALPQIDYSWVANPQILDTTSSITDAVVFENSEFLLRMFGICQDTLFQSVLVDSIEVEISSDLTELCAPAELIQLQAFSSGAGTSFLLSNSNTFQDTLLFQTGDSAFDFIPDINFQNYYLKAFNALNCEALDSFQVVVHEFYPKSLNDSIVCRGIQFAIEALDSVGQINQIQWEASNQIVGSLNAQTVSVLPDTSAFFVFSASDINNCLARDTVFIQVNEVQLNSIPDTLLCVPFSAFQLPVNSFETASSFLMSSQSDFSDTLFFTNTDTFFVIDGIQQSGQFYIYALDSISCADTIDFAIDLSFFELETLQDVAICFGDTVQASARSNQGTIQSISWQNTNDIIGSNSENDVLLKPSETALFYFEAFNPDSCYRSDTLEVYVSQIAFDSLAILSSADTVLSGETIDLESISSAYSLEWQPENLFDDNTLSSAQIQLNNSTLISLKYSDLRANQCQQVVEKNLVVFESVCEEPFVFIPNAFSPNGDGDNDVFKVRGTFLQEVDLKVFDRWGQKLFDSEGTQKAWDGTYNGQLVHADVFTYTARVVCAGGEVFQKSGNVTVLK